MSAPERSSFFPASRPREGGRSSNQALVITERPSTLVQVTARKGKADALATAIRETFGLALPEAGGVTSAPDIAALWLQPGTWLVMASATRHSLPAELRDGLAGRASVVDQSHGRCVLDVVGAEARAVLGRLCRLDLHERVFPALRGAGTLIGHVPCQLYRLEAATPSFRLIVGSTFGEWLFDELAAASASCGWRFVPTGEATA